MTLFKLLLQSSGLSLREAAELLNSRIDTIKSWSSGRNNAPDGVLYEMSEIIDNLEDQAFNVYNHIKNHPSAERYEIGYCADDEEARSLGFKCKSLHDAALRRVLEYCEPHEREKLVIVPRGSTAGTAAAIDQHE